MPTFDYYLLIAFAVLVVSLAVVTFIFGFLNQLGTCILNFKHNL